ncbi:MAG: hypothetical protein J5970_03695 [Bacilli bacterium]|nr:hypothetical protein [Bacilli bacterium]
MKREREKHITRLHIILFFLVVIIGLTTFFIVRGKINKRTDKYKTFEKDIVTASKIYYKLKNIKVKDGYEKRVNIKKIEKEGLIQNELIEDCKGYVIMSSERDMYTDEYEIEHRAYIKCGKNYTTVNYFEE